MLRRAISQVCRGVVAVHRAISQARGGSLRNYESSAVGESSCPVCNACVPSARWPARRNGRAKRMGRKKREAKRTQDGKQQVRQDAGPTIRCTRAQKRLPHAPGYCIIHLSGRLRRRIVALSRRPIKPKSNHNKKENIEYESSSHCHRQRYRRHPC